MKNLNLLIKPSSSSCNMKCTYCFYHDVSNKRKIKNYGLMSIKTAEILIKKSFDYAKQSLTFSFQGGEPTIWGLDNFKRFITIVNENNTQNKKVFYALQTNGVLINDEWAEFFAQNNFLIGVSLDGYKQLHDSNRIIDENTNTFNIVMNSIDILKKHDVQFNILTVITKYSVRNADKIYNFFKKNNFEYLQFIPCIDDFEKNSSEYSITSTELEIFLKITFDRWYDDILQKKGISIRYFDNILSILAGYPPEICTMNGFCTCMFVVEADGGVYPCDFYVLDNYKIGNITENSFSEMKQSNAAHQFINESKTINEHCKACKHLYICRGGCKRDKEPQNGNINRFCKAYYNFFDYSLFKFQHLLTLLTKIN